MRILITNNHLGDLGGTETWVLTMARYLSQFHDVGVYTKHKGYVSSLLSDLIDDHPVDYDLALINHNSCIGVSARKKIFTSHGVIPQLEKPEGGCDIYVAVNENVAEHFGLDIIIKNPIDTELYKPTSKIRERPERILALTNGDIPIPHKNGRRNEFIAADHMNDADLVVSMGRGALEAMSCARNVIVWDNKSGWGWRGDGYMDDPNRIKGFVAGPYLKREINWDEELAKYDPKQGERNRQYILEHHTVEKIAEQYLAL